MSQSTPETIKRYDPSTDKMINVTQEYFDLLHQKLIIFQRLFKTNDIEILKRIWKAFDIK